VKHPDDCELGSIYLGSEFIEKQCIKKNESFETRIEELLAHAICHLLGYRHNSDPSHQLVSHFMYFVFIFYYFYFIFILFGQNL